MTTNEVKQVIVETNWVLDVALSQDPGSVELLDLAERGVIAVLLPSFCLAESITRLESMRREWNKLGARVGEMRRDADRSGALSAYVEPLNEAQFQLAQLRDQAEAVFWPALRRIAQTAQSLDLNPEIVDLIPEGRALNLRPPDATVLATVVWAAGKGTCSNFMSRDKKGFATMAVTQYMEQRGVRYFDSANPIVGPLRK